MNTLIRYVIARIKLRQYKRKDKSGKYLYRLSKASTGTYYISKVRLLENGRYDGWHSADIFRVADHQRVKIKNGKRKLKPVNPRKERIINIYRLKF